MVVEGLLLRGGLVEVEGLRLPGGLVEVEGRRLPGGLEAEVEHLLQEDLVVEEGHLRGDQAEVVVHLEAGLVEAVALQEEVQVAEEAPLAEDLVAEAELLAANLEVVEERQEEVQVVVEVLQAAGPAEEEGPQATVQAAEAALLQQIQSALAEVAGSPIQPMAAAEFPVHSTQRLVLRTSHRVHWLPSWPQQPPRRDSSFPQVWLPAAS